MAASGKPSMRGRSSRFFHLGDKPEDISSEGVYVYYQPALPEGPPPSDKPEVLKVGDEFHIPPKTFGLRLGFDWDAEGVDLDASAALFNSNRAKMDYVWWDNPKSSDESVTFRSGDNREALESGDKEVIGVEIDHLANEVAYIVLSVSVYSKGKTMKDSVNSLRVRGFDSEAGDKELFTYTADSDLRGTTVLLGVLVREGAWFKFVPLKNSILSRTVTEIMYEPSNLNPAFAKEAVPLERRMLKMSVKKGRNLTPMDISLFKKRSDPYLKIFYRGKTFKSEVVYGTLAPTYNMEPLDIGEVVECDDDVVDIQIWDWDKLTDHDFMGMIRICVGGVCQQGAGTHSKWIPVSATQEQKDNNEKITGELLFEFSMVNLEDYDPSEEAAKKAAEKAAKEKMLQKDVASIMEKSWRHA